MSDMQRMLCRLCNACGGLYYWCDHYGNNWRVVPLEEARVEAAKLLLRVKFGDFDPDEHPPAEVKRTIHEVFGAEEVT